MNLNVEDIIDSITDEEIDELATFNLEGESEEDDLDEDEACGCAFPRSAARHFEFELGARDYSRKASALARVLVVVCQCREFGIGLGLNRFGRTLIYFICKRAGVDEYDTALAINLSKTGGNRSPFASA